MGVPPSKRGDCLHLARERTSDIYYNHEDNENDGGGGHGYGRGSGGGEKRSQQVLDHDEQAARRKKVRSVGWQGSNTADSQAPDVADMILALWMQNARKGQCQANAMKADRTRKKVQAWLESAE